MAQANAEQLEQMMTMHTAMMQQLTPEQNEENKQKFTAMFGDADKMAAAKAEGEKLFTDADKDGDGILSLEEFHAYGIAGEAMAKEKGWHLPASTEEQRAQWWNMMTTAAGTPNGISMADHSALQGQVRGEYAKRNGLA